MQRIGNEPVPGCTGLTSDYSGIDFCYDENDIVAPTGNNLERVGNNGSPAFYPLPKCKGDCDNSEQDCEGHLQCFQRSSGDPGPPGCTGNPEGDTDYCYDPADVNDVNEPVDVKDESGGGGSTSPPTLDNSLDRVGNDGDPSSYFPLPKCKGDCDGDGDCQGSLTCFQRRSGDPGPPGCAGTPEGDTDYCFDTQDIPSSGSLIIVGNDGSPSSVFPLKACQGDCDSSDGKSYS